MNRIHVISGFAIAAIALLLITTTMSDKQSAFAHRNHSHHNHNHHHGGSGSSGSCSWVVQPQLQQLAKVAGAVAEEQLVAQLERAAGAAGGR